MLQEFKISIRARIAVFLAAAFVVGQACAQSTKEISVDLTAVPGTVTYSNLAGTNAPAQTSYAGFLVKLTNISTNNVNNIRFNVVANSAIAANLGNGTPVVVEGSGTAPVCTIPSANVLNCDVGRLLNTDAQRSISFFFAVQAPVLPATLPDPPAQVTVDTTTLWGGTGTSGGNEGGDGNALKSAAATLAPRNAVTASTFVLSTFGQLLYTGPVRSATASDPWTTSVAIPAYALSLKASIDEALETSSCSAVLTQCFSTLLSIVKASDVTQKAVFTSGVLSITLRRDVSTIPSKLKIANTTITYEGTPVQSCFLTGAYVAPTPGVPCIYSQRQITKQDIRADPVNLSADDEGDFEYVIHAADNGRYVG